MFIITNKSYLSKRKRVIHRMFISMHGCYNDWLRSKQVESRGSFHIILIYKNQGGGGGALDHWVGAGLY